MKVVPPVATSTDIEAHATPVPVEPEPWPVRHARKALELRQGLALSYVGTAEDGREYGVACCHPNIPNVALTDVPGVTPLIWVQLKSFRQAELSEEYQVMNIRQMVGLKVTLAKLQPRRNMTAKAAKSKSRPRVSQLQGYVDGRWVLSKRLGGKDSALSSELVTVEDRGIGMVAGLHPHQALDLVIAVRYGRRDRINTVFGPPPPADVIGYSNSDGVAFHLICFPSAAVVENILRAPAQYGEIRTGREFAYPYTCERCKQPITL